MKIPFYKKILSKVALRMIGLFLLFDLLILVVVILISMVVGLPNGAYERCYGLTTNYSDHSTCRGWQIILKQPPQLKNAE